MLVAWELGKYL